MGRRKKTPQFTCQQEYPVDVKIDIEATTKKWLSENKPYGGDNPDQKSALIHNGAVLMAADTPQEGWTWDAMRRIENYLDSVPLPRKRPDDYRLERGVFEIHDAAARHRSLRHVYYAGGTWHVETLAFI